MDAASSKGPERPEALDARRLRAALEAGELHLHYQPKVALDTNRVMGVEALVRWAHPDLGTISPLDFVPMAERCGLIEPIGAWVLGEACRQVARWRRDFPDRDGLVMSVNVSACQFRPELVEVVTDAVRTAGIDPGNLCLEITESVLMTDVQGAVVILQQLAAFGVSVSIDDFGTGYSSLAYLKTLPIHELKIDRSFVSGLGNDRDDTAIVAAIVAMAHALDLRVVAEGVETHQQLRELRVLGCEVAQGFHFARPGPPRCVDDIFHAEAASSWRSHGDPEPGTGTYRRDRVLVIDDQPDARLLARFSLAAVGFEVHEATNGIEGLAAARQLEPDCVVLDLVMPGLTGLEVCIGLREDPATRNATILVLTSEARRMDKARAFASGADDYVVKPFSPRELASRVTAAISRRRGDIDVREETPSTSSRRV